MSKDSYAKTVFGRARPKKNKGKRPIAVGEKVRVRVGGGWLKAVVIEDRGNLGVGGRRILRVRSLGSFTPPAEWELPAVECRRERAK